MTGHNMLHQLAKNVQYTKGTMAAGDMYKEVSMGALVFYLCPN